MKIIFQIDGGGLNKVCGGYSSILGGTGNTVPDGLHHAGVFGQNVAAVASNTFHVECLNAINTPIYLGGGAPFLPGTVFACNSGGAGVPLGALPLYFQP